MFNSGVLRVGAEVGLKGGSGGGGGGSSSSSSSSNDSGEAEDWEVKKVSMSRTARRIMEGHVFLPPPPPSSPS